MTPNPVFDAIAELDGDSKDWLNEPEQKPNDRSAYEKIVGRPTSPGASDGDGDADVEPEKSRPSRALLDEEPEQELSEADKRRYDAALRAVKRAKTPKSVIEKMDREELIAWGEELSSVHDEVDSAFDELARSRRNGANESKEDSEGENGGESAPAPKKVSLSRDLVTPFVQALGLGDDENAVKAAMTFGEKIAEHVAKSVGTSKSTKDPEMAAMKQVLETLLAKQARSELVEKFPKLEGDDASWKKVLKKYSALWGSGEYRDAHTALEDAAKLVLGPSEAQPPPQPRAKRGGSPTVTSRPIAKKASREESDLAVYRHIRRNPGDVRGAKRVGGLQ